MHYFLKNLMRFPHNVAFLLHLIFKKISIYLENLEHMIWSEFKSFLSICCFFIKTGPECSNKDLGKSIAQYLEHLHFVHSTSDSNFTSSTENFNIHMV